MNLRRIWPSLSRCPTGKSETNSGEDRVVTEIMPDGTRIRTDTVTGLVEMDFPVSKQEYENLKQNAAEAGLSASELGYKILRDLGAFA
jgi:hypothetical protein